MRSNSGSLPKQRRNLVLSQGPSKNQYTHTHIDNIAHHHISNVTMIINGDYKEDEDEHIIERPHIINNDRIDSVDTDLQPVPHIINDEESYMHSLTLAQVEHATQQNILDDNDDRHITNLSQPAPVMNDMESMNYLHPMYNNNNSSNPSFPGIYPHPLNKKILVNAVSNPFRVDSMERSRTINKDRRNSINTKITKTTSIHDDGLNFSDTEHGHPRSPLSDQHLHLHLQHPNDDSTKVQITPRTPIHSNSEFLVTPHIITDNLSMDAAMTAIVHTSRNTFDVSQTIDISTLQLTSKENIRPGITQNQDLDSEDSSSEIENSSELKHNLSDKISHLYMAEVLNCGVPLRIDLSVDTASIGGGPGGGCGG